MNRQIFRGAAASVVYTATTVLAGVIQLRVVVRALPGDMAGLWLLFLTIGSYAAWFDMGISPTVGREISFSLGAQELSEAERTRRVGELLATLWQVFRTLAAGVGLLSLLAGEIVIWASPHSSGPPSVAWAWALFSLGISLSLLGGTGLAGLFGLGSVATEKIVRSAAALIGLALAIAALLLGWGILGLAAAWTLQWLAAGLISWHLLRRRFPEVTLVGHTANWQLAGKLASPSLKLASIQLGAILILQSADPLIAAFIGTAAIPPYEAVSKLALTMMSLAFLVVNSSTPFLSIAYAAGQTGKFTRLLIGNLQIGVGLMVVLAAFAAVNGDRIVAVWLGGSMFAGFPVVWALLAMVLLEVHHVVFATAAMAAGQIVFVRAALASGVLNIMLAVVLAPRWGLIGIALAIAISQLLTNNWYAPYITIRFFGVRIAVLVREVWLPMIVLLGGQLVANFGLRRLPWLGTLSLAAVVANFGVASCLGAGMWWLVVADSRERARVLERLLGWSRVRAERA